MVAIPIAAPAPAPFIKCGVSASIHANETELGDAYVVAPHDIGVLVAVADGLGHGAEAAEAANLAVTILERHADAPPVELIKLCHTGLRKTRGAVLSIASFDASKNMMTWIGIGNVEGTLFRAARDAAPAKETLLLRSGVVGYQLPPLRSATLPIHSGDTLVLTTDGIRSNFYEESPTNRDPQSAADAILSAYDKGTDDALVVVTRYVGLHP